MQNNESFWMVWNPMRNAPVYQHRTLNNAIAEAERLARENPGQTFIVLESVMAIVVNDIQRTSLRPNQELPF